MKKTILGLIEGLREVREVVELEIVSEEEVPLLTFRDEPEVIGQILKDLKECLL